MLHSRRTTVREHGHTWNIVAPAPADSPQMVTFLKTSEIVNTHDRPPNHRHLRRISAKASYISLNPLQTDALQGNDDKMVEGSWSHYCIPGLASQHSATHSLLRKLTQLRIRTALNDIRKTRKSFQVKEQLASAELRWLDYFQFGILLLQKSGHCGMAEIGRIAVIFLYVRMEEFKKPEWANLGKARKGRILTMKPHHDR